MTGNNLKIKKSDRIQAFFCLFLGIILLGYSLYHHFNIQISWGLSPYLFPALIGSFLIVLAIILFVNAFYQSNQSLKELTTPKKCLNIQKLIVTLVMIFLYYIGIIWMGFILSSIIFLAGMLWLLGEKRQWLILVLSIVVSFILYGLFHNLLHVMLP